MSIATLSSKSQLVIPAKIRRKLGIEPGDRLSVEAEGDQVVIRKTKESDVQSLAAFRSDIWRDQADELQRSRDEWDP